MYVCISEDFLLTFSEVGDRMDRVESKGEEKCYGDISNAGIGF